jgi:hypothetical protein
MGDIAGVKTVRRLASFGTPPVPRAGEIWRYGLGMPLQISEDRIAMVLNIRRDNMPYVDFEAGADAVLFGSLVGKPLTLEISRNHVEPDPQSGEDLVIVKYPATGGFVPAGARLPDGSPHPHSGTGFGIIHAIGFPLPTTDPRMRLRLPAGYHEFAELHQYRTEGRNLMIESTRRYRPGALPAGVSHRGTSFTTAIPDGVDLLFGMRDLRGATGVARWKRDGPGWLPVEFHRVPGTKSSIEPSLVRDVDGSYLFCTRGERRDSIHAINVWRSLDCREWQRIIHQNWMIGRGPVTVNSAADGTPYVAANPLLEGQEHYAYGQRGVLQIWPLTRSREGLQDPIVVCDGPREFGESPSGRGWYIDHPSGQTLRLGNGEWRHLLVYRVADRGEVTDGTDPVEVTGCHVSEVVSGGGPLAPWVF